MVSNVRTMYFLRSPSFFCDECNIRRVVVSNAQRQQELDALVVPVWASELVIQFESFL